ncbi:MAG: hypothetical protein J6K33_09320 [Alistipes sp.]|nr:hypothetical protein [Alistipes sp.]MBP3498018.1 hypothetical protein [Alistipes sp.]
MKRFLYSSLLAVALLLCPGCNNGPEGSDEKTTVTVLATLENGRQWHAGDEVVINNIKYTIEVDGTTTASIEGVEAADYYYAAYDFGNGAIDGTNLSLELPAVQSPSVSTIMPMVASNGNTKLVFKNLLGTLRLSLSGSGTVTRLVLSSFDTALAGHGVADMNFAGAPALEIAADGSRSVTVDLGQGVTLPADVDVVLPAMTYSGFTLTAYGTNDEIMSGYSISTTEVLRGDVQLVNVAYAPDTEAPTYITATVENDVDGNPYTWNVNSVLYINGVPASLAGGQGSANGEFGPVSTADIYYASTSSASANGLSGQSMRIAIPATQRYNMAIATINPAVAKSATNNLSLNYLGGVATVKITGPHALRQVSLMGKNNRRLAGSGVVDMSTETARLSLNPDAAKEIIVDCGTAGVNIESGATFRFVLPADDYSEGFTLSMLDTNGQTLSYEVAGCTINRNAVTALEDVEWLSAQGDGNNLSRLGYANCYMVHMAGDYTFKTRKIDNSPINNIAKVDWLWVSKVEGQQGNALISNISYADGTVSFTASEHEGNALLAAFDSTGNIVWSWHIWMTDKPEVFDYQNNAIPQSNGQTDGYYCMDRNLGATDATALGGYETFGLYYQWGRKDPFVGDATEERARDVQNGGWMNVTAPFGNSSSLTVCNSAYTQAAWSATATSAAIGSIEYATANPMTFLTGDPTSNKADWLNLNNLGAEKNNIIYDADKSLWRPFQKSNYDPCPVGYQVPRKAMWVSLLSTNCVHTEYKGFVNTTDSGQSVWYPSAGYRSAHPADAGALMSVQNDTGFVKLWSSELEASELSFCFTFNYPLYNAINSASWGNGYNVRCVKAY